MSIGAHKIRVADAANKDTLDLNVLAASHYHFDFDGKLNMVIWKTFIHTAVNMELPSKWWINSVTP